MNISLTWTNYVLIAGVCLSVYYLVIGLIYNRKKLLKRLQPKKELLNYVPNQQIHSSRINANENSSFLHASEMTNTFSAVDERENSKSTIEDFMDEIDAYTQACGNTITKEELGINLQRILQKYPSLTSSSLRGVLAGIVATASEANCSIQWREEELNEWWIS